VFQNFEHLGFKLPGLPTEPSIKGTKASMAAVDYLELAVVSSSTKLVERLN
jgi:hypothetical protein